MSLSGGMDSTTVLNWLINAGYLVECVSFTYGSKHNPFEKQSAIDVANFYDIPLHHFDLSLIFKNFTSNLLTGQGEIPEGHYTDQSMSKTVVPGRNIIFLSILAGLAWSIGATKIAIGIHQGDHAIYADCRAEFYKAMDLALYLGTDNKVEIIAPFLNTDKTGILEWGLKHKTPYQLTRTCYKEQSLSCGKCGSCVERLEAFKNQDVKDPIQYEG